MLAGFYHRHAQAYGSVYKGVWHLQWGAARLWNSRERKRGGPGRPGTAPILYLSVQQIYHSKTSKMLQNLIKHSEPSKDYGFIAENSGAHSSCPLHPSEPA